jgi:hypothetical protein
MERVFSRRRLLPLAVLAAFLATGAVALAAISTGSYSGQSSEHAAVTFRVVKKGHPARLKAKSFSTQVGYDGKCGQGGGPVYVVKANSIPVNSSGNFSKVVLAKFATGSSSSVKFKIKGHLSGSSATGSVAAKGQHCAPPHQKKNPFSVTFSATRH